MPLDFAYLLIEIDRIIDQVAEEAQRAPGWILNEDDLKCIFYSRFIQLPTLSEFTPTQDEGVLGSSVHTELTWYKDIEPGTEGEPWHGSLKPDITIIEPEHLSILHGYVEPVGTYNKRTRFHHRGNHIHPREELPPLRSKQFEFGGKAILIELKFARRGMNPNMVRAINYDLLKIQKIFERLDNNGEGNNVYAYVVVFDKHGPARENILFSDIRGGRGSHRHKVIYKSIGVTPLR